MFAEFIHKHLKKLLKKATIQRTKLFLQDGDPSQNSKKPIMSCTNWGPKNSVYPHGNLT